MFFNILIDCIAIALFCCSGIYVGIAVAENDEFPNLGIITFILGIVVFVASQIVFYHTITLR